MAVKDRQRTGLGTHLRSKGDAVPFPFLSLTVVLCLVVQGGASKGGEAGSGMSLDRTFGQDLLANSGIDFILMQEACDYLP